MKTALDYREEAIRISQLGRDYHGPYMLGIMNRLSHAYEGMARDIDTDTARQAHIITFVI